MKKYTFSVDGASVSVFTAEGGEIVREKILCGLREGELAALISLDRECDFQVECFDKNNNTPREPHLPLAALSCFFERVRSYPKMTLDISCGGKKYEIKTNENDGYKFSVNSGKCKTLCSKTVKFSDGIEIRADIVSSDKLYAVTVCEDSELFDTGRLLLLFESLKASGVSSAVVLSFGDELRIKSVGEMPFYEAIRIAADVLGSMGITLPEGEHDALVSGRRHRFSVAQRQLIFSPEIQYIS